MPAQIFYGDAMNDSVMLNVSIREKLSGKVVANKSMKLAAKRDNLSEAILDIPIKEVTAWTPEKPFLYSAKATLENSKGISDETEKHFGMRGFHPKGEILLLNGERIILRGTNVTLQRFFEDRIAEILSGNKEWVKKLIIDNSKTA